MKPLPMKPAQSLGVVVVATFALLVAACSSGATPTPQASGPAGGASAQSSGGAVTISGFKFGPATLDVAAGSTVAWTNNDSTAHTVTADDGSFDSKSVSPGTTYSQAFPKAGTFTYHCSIHPSMKATITVH